MISFNFLASNQYFVLDPTDFLSFWLLNLQKKVNVYI